MKEIAPTIHQADDCAYPESSAAGVHLEHAEGLNYDHPGYTVKICKSCRQFFIVGQDYVGSGADYWWLARRPPSAIHLYVGLIRCTRPLSEKYEVRSRPGV